MKTVTVEVTQDNIARGISGGCERCPIALAMSRAFGVGIGVGLVHWWYLGDRSRVYELPYDAQQFIAEFDDQGDVEPIQFEVDDFNEAKGTA